MRRPFALPLLLLILVAGCDQSSDDTTGAVPPPPAPRMMGGLAAPAVAMKAAAPQADKTEGPKLAYHHWLSFQMPATSVAPRYERARDKCLAAGADCVLTNASIDAGDSRIGRTPHASLTVRLSHAAVDDFEQSIAAPVTGETPGAAELRSRNTTADDLTAAIQDTDRRLAQLTDYRDRLTELAKRPDAEVDDLIKVEQELANTQSEIEEIAAQQKTLNQQVATELVTVNLDADAPAASAAGPIVQVWNNAGTVLGRNAANALRFVIGAAPWAVIALVLLALLALVRLVVRRRR